MDDKDSINVSEEQSLLPSDKYTKEILDGITRYSRKTYPPGSKDLTDSEKEKVHVIAISFEKQRSQKFYPNQYLKKWANRNRADLNEDMFTYLLYNIGFK
tara:strand:- start:1657 stop:1956 length:300 start_codon:yes stop_codon:yes gene_type:complete